MKWALRVLEKFGNVIEREPGSRLPEITCGYLETRRTQTFCALRRQSAPQSFVNDVSEGTIKSARLGL
jgi:hypothetical protein